MKILKYLLFAAASLFSILVIILLAGYLMSRSPATDGTISHNHIPRDLVIAHRGASYLAPDETRPAYILARDLGTDYLEFDVQRTSDGILICVHDETLERTTDIDEIFPDRKDAPTGSFTLAEIKRLDAGTWFNRLNPRRARELYRGLKKLTLDEALDIAETTGRRSGLYIETKDAHLYPGIERQLAAKLRQRGWIVDGNPAGSPGSILVRTFSGRNVAPVIFQSFELESLDQLRKLAPDVPRIYLVKEETEKALGWEKLVNDAAQARCAGIGPVGYLGWPWYTGRAHRRGLLVHIYTIDEGWQFFLFDCFGADGFFTNRCDRLMSYYGITPACTPKSILDSLKR